MKVLFLLKKNNNYGSYTGPRTGLYNSAFILAEQLNKHLGIKTSLQVVIDGNSVDKEVHQYKPDVCIIEALWITPKKLHEVKKLHPKVDFIVRLHSEISFLANEGSAFDYLSGYENIGVKVAVNSSDTYEELKSIYKNVIYLPNIYEDLNITYKEATDHAKHMDKFNLDPKPWTRLSWDAIDIGCFGAIRPMKNHLIQAVAAINYADTARVKLRFHINASRVEQKGESILKNLRSLFGSTKHELVEHGWLPRGEFLHMIEMMDLGMQVSLTESFNVVAADFVKQGVPIVVSPAIKWMPEFSQASPIEGVEIQTRIGQAIRYKKLFVLGQKVDLVLYNFNSLKIWSKFFGNIR